MSLWAWLELALTGPVADFTAHVLAAMQRIKQGTPEPGDYQMALLALYAARTWHQTGQQQTLRTDGSRWLIAA